MKGKMNSGDMIPAKVAKKVAKKVVKAVAKVDKLKGKMK